jgi:hypothetical protein
VQTQYVLVSGSTLQTATAKTRRKSLQRGTASSSGRTAALVW